MAAKCHICTSLFVRPRENTPRPGAIRGLIMNTAENRRIERIEALFFRRKPLASRRRARSARGRRVLLRRTHDRRVLPVVHRRRRVVRTSNSSRRPMPPSVRASVLASAASRPVLPRELAIVERAYADPQQRMTLAQLGDASTSARSICNGSSRGSSAFRHHVSIRRRSARACSAMRFNTAAM